jgi:hypothetical protein
MLLSIVLGSIFSVVMAHVMVNYNWSRIFLRFFNRNKSSWEKVFDNMIKFETLRLGNLIKRNPFRAKKRETSNKKQTDNTSVDRESQKLLETWYCCEAKTLRNIQHIFKQQGHINILGLPIKMHMRDIISGDDCKEIKASKLNEYLLAKLYLRTIRDEILRGNSLNNMAKLNEQIDFNNSVILLYILKCGGSEKSCREQMIKSPKALSLRLKNYSVTKFENIERELLISFQTLKPLFSYIRNEGRKQNKFAQDYLEKQKKSQNKKNNSKTDKKKTSSHTQEALDILEMSCIVDLKTLKKNYKHMAMKHHPDRQDHNSQKEQQVAHDKFVKINNAYHILSKKCA